jgi:hypothetical protein
MKLSIKKLSSGKVAIEVIVPSGGKLLKTETELEPFQMQALIDLLTAVLKADKMEFSTEF